MSSKTTRAAGGETFSLCVWRSARRPAFEREVYESLEEAADAAAELAEADGVEAVEVCRNEPPYRAELVVAGRAAPREGRSRGRRRPRGGAG